MMRLTLLLVSCFYFVHATSLTKGGQPTIHIHEQQTSPRTPTTGRETKLLNGKRTRLRRLNLPNRQQLENLSNRQQLEITNAMNNKDTDLVNSDFGRDFRKNIKRYHDVVDVVKISKSLNNWGKRRHYQKQYHSADDIHDHLEINEVSTNYQEGFLLDVFARPDPELKGICPFPWEKYNTDLQLDLHLGFDKRDKFDCSSRCMCQWVDTRQTPEKVVAYCNEKKLVSVPQHLPSVTKRIEISHNNISELNFGSIYEYPYLQTFTARNCSIRKILTLSNTMTSPLLQELDLSYNKIESFMFVGFPNLNVLRLTGNNIFQVKASFFQGLRELKFLSLSQNNVLQIDSNSFQYLPNLEVLDLSANSLLGYHSFTPDLFKDIKNLKVLNIQNSSNGAEEYPNEAIGELQFLVELNIDALAFPAEFKSQFATLKYLKNLKFGPLADCRLKNMPDSFFQYVPNISCLFFQSCNMTINPKAYGSFKQLKALTVENIPNLILDTAFAHLEDFRTKSLQYIGFKNLIKQKWPCVWLWDSQGKHMNGFDNLTVINLSVNRLSLLADSFIETIPLKTEKLILSKNKFDLLNVLWTTLIRLTNLTYLDLSMQNWERNNLYYPAQFGYRPNNTKLTRNRREVGSLISSHTAQLIKISQSKGLLQIPQKLQTVKASMYHSFGSILLSNTIGNNSLKNLNFSKSGLLEWGHGRLPKDVEIVDLSSNSATTIDYNFFSPNNSLRDLHLQVNFLGDFIGNTNVSVFENLGNLEYLDLTTNVIYAIPYKFFKGLKNVKAIHLGNNRLETLNVSFEDMPNLKFLDLHRNSLSWISKTSRDQMEKLEGLVVDFHFNSFRCHCDSIDLLQWMVVTKVYFLNLKLYTCHDLDNRPIYLGSRKEIKIKVDYLRRHCTSWGYFIIVGVATGFVFVFLSIGGFAYRKRWWIRYKFHVLCAKSFGYKPQNKNDLDDSYHLYDAFLLYVKADRSFALRCSKELEKKRHHKLCIGDRDIIPGTNEFAAIVGFIQNSRYTLIVITDNFIQEMNKKFREDPMVEHAIQMALMEEYCTSRKTLHLMLCSNGENANYPRYILKILRDQNVTSFPSLNEEQIVSISMINSFWDTMSYVIGHSRDHDEDYKGWNFNSYFFEGD